MNRHLRFTTLVTALSISCATAAEATLQASSGEDARKVLVLVDGKPVTANELRFLMLSRNVPEKLQPKVRKQFLEQLIDRRLMRDFLAGRKATPDKIELEEQIVRLHKLLKKQGYEPKETLEKIGYTERRLREELSLPLAWKVHVNRMVTPQRLRDYFQQHKQEFDGTQVRAAQILLKVPDPNDFAAVETAKRELQSLRKQIFSREITFSKAAEQHSQAPSKNAGGDLGFFPYRGKMPLILAGEAFKLKTGEITEPFVTPFGVHLLTVTDRKPGSLSLEDARDSVLKQLSDELWDEIVLQERSRVKIEWKIPTE